MYTLRFRSLLAFTLLTVLLSACNMPRDTPAASGVDAINTAAAETVVARLTQAALPPPTQPGVTTAPTQAAGETPAAPAPTQGSPTAGATADAGATASACDRVKFVDDVTYPDDTQVAAGQSFVKTWRLENAGTCAWTTAYALVFIEGDRMEAPETVPLPAEVAPGATVDLSVTLKAPAEPGTYRGDFTLRNAAGTRFGIGSKDEAFYVQIDVPGDAANTGGGFDFVSRAATAAWASGAGNTLDTSLAFAGADDDANGVAAIKDGVRLETGAVSGKVLLTVPKRVENGAIAGTFSEYTVGRGEHLKARLTFLANPDGSCGAGNVVFQVAYKAGDTVQVLQEWEKPCNGSAIPVDIDLSSLRNQTVQFVFIVRANGSFQDDWAVWNSPRIE